MSDEQQISEAYDNSFEDQICDHSKEMIVKSPSLIELHAAIKTKRPNYTIIFRSDAEDYLAGIERYRVEATEDPEVFELGPALFDPSGRGMDEDVRYLWSLEPIERAALIHQLKYRSDDERYKSLVLSVKDVSWEGAIAQGLLDKIEIPRKNLPYWYKPYQKSTPKRYEDGLLAAFGIEIS